MGTGALRRRRRHLSQTIAQSQLGIMLVMVPLVYLVTVIAAWRILALTWSWVVALAITLVIFGLVHLSGTRARRRTRLERPPLTQAGCERVARGR